MKVRIGIDVGGTFTDVVVIDQETRELIGQLKTPTTHTAAEGVALGIVQALEQAMMKFGLEPDDVAFIAHSTTQATNALLEGDVARVGVIGAGGGLEGFLAKRATIVPPIPLAANKTLSPLYEYVDVTKKAFENEVERAVGSLFDKGAQVIVGSEAFGVDRSEVEKLIAKKARSAGLIATSGHEVSGLYGLRVRTRTAVINAAILPKMIETAQMTESCVKSSGIRAPLMIMRSDGGVMSVDEVRRRPILTMLSGPAAGIAGALMHERVSDGIFIEVGGTSADISVIRDGSPAIRPARLNGHRMYLNTLDVRTLGVGGGSMIRLAEKGSPEAIVDVGPRSAHIAGLGYVCYAEDPSEIETGRLELISPAASDPPDHAIIRTSGGRGYAITTTCAANLLGLVEPQNFAYGSRESAKRAFKLVSERFGQFKDEFEAAEKMLEIGCRKVVETIEELMAEYHLSRDQVVLIGGGGGAAALLPFAARMMNLEHRIARNAEVISPIGVAMAMVRDVVERNIVDPSPEDILRVRREAEEAALAAGAVSGSVEVQVEVDKRRNLVRATAMGTTELRHRERAKAALTQDELRQAAARSMRIPPDEVRLEAEAGEHLVFTGELRAKSFCGILKSRRRLTRVTDRKGVIRLQRASSRVTIVSIAEIEDELERAVEELTDYGDAGRAIPDIFLLYGARIANFSGLSGLDQVIALANVELRSLDSQTRTIVIACPKLA